MAEPVFIVQTGTANTASVLASLRRCGTQPCLTEDPDTVRRAQRVVLPGVGALASAMDQLESIGMTAALTERLRQGRPTLAVCLGLQLLASGSQESPGRRALGIFPGLARRFPACVKVPQLGWNRIVAQGSCRLLRDGYAYFANSYCLTETPRGWSAALADHGGTFVAALEQGDILACQFHPELSSAFGLDLQKRWLRASALKGVSSC
jgi:imidazole glycerol-phosphate synthase subunit HisH